MSAELDFHRLLLRQLKRVGLGTEKPPADQPSWAALLDRVSRAYRERDEEHYLLERSQDMASQEMAALYAKVRADRDLLETRVQERTQALQVSEERLASLLSLSADWIWEQDADLCFTYVSEGLEAASGVKPAELLGAQRLNSHAFDAEPEAAAAYQQCVQARRPFRDFTYGYTRPDGVKRYIRISGEPVFGEAGNFAGYRGVGRDVTTVTEAQLKVHELARFDSLTGLPNRSMFLGELDQAIARGKRHGLPFAVCFIDLDRFKAINDRLGHAAGDELLCAMAGRLRGALRETDLVARLGGDEFVVLLDGVARTDALEVTASKLLQALAEPLVLRDCNLAVSGSIGVATFPEDGADAAMLLQHADAAMYQAKRHGRNEVRFYTTDLADMSSQDFETESALRLALVREELVLHYQPKMEAAGARMVGMEALVRWRHPTRGMVPPMEFIPLAEERGLIVPIGRWVMQAACRQVRLWRDAGLVPVPVAINLSALQFASESLMRDLRDAMAEHRVTARDLEVELTESVLMADPARASDLLQQMHEMGLRISIDDFGTGYSSLSYLKRFPAQMVKVDRSFVGGLPADANDKAITEAVIALAHSLGLGVVAEGVETEAQLALLRQLGCDEVQGYLTGRPMPADAMAQRLEAR